MAKLHDHFLAFHNAIKLDDLDENATLREKRDTLIKNLKNNWPADAPEILRTFNQGSYAMGTGMVPLDGDYDIDVGIEFDGHPDDVDPVNLKKQVRQALSHPKRTIDIRRSCVTVSYIKGEETQYHVDLALYVKGSDGKLNLAKGKENSGKEFCFWEIADPEELCSLIIKKHKDDDRAQFRRAIRYLKRWRDKQFDHDGVISIALTVAAYHWFSPYKSLSGEYDDLEGLLRLLNTMLGNWMQCFHESVLATRLKVTLPVVPNRDLLGEMTEKQMDDFKEKLTELRDALKEAKAEPEERVACKALAKFFGDDFPIPEDSKDKAAKVRASVVGTGSSA